MDGREHAQPGAKCRACRSAREKTMCLNVWRHFLLTWCAICIAGVLFGACGAAPHPEKTSTAPAFAEEFSSALVDGEEFTVPPGQALVMYADHLPQAGG